MTIHSIEMNVQSPEWVLAGSLLGSVLSPDRKGGINVSTTMDSTLAAKYAWRSKHRQEEE